MGLLERKSSEGNADIIGNLLNSYVNTESDKSPHSQGVISQLLDRDNDGNVMDDIAELGMSFLGRMMKR